MAEFVVAPSTVLTVPNYVIGIEMIKQIATSENDHTKFSTLVKRRPRTSSIESFVGKTQNGAAIATTNRIP